MFTANDLNILTSLRALIILNYDKNISYRCIVLFEIYIVHTPTNTLFITLVKSFKFTLKHTIMSLLHVLVFSDHQGALSVPN